MLRVAEPSVAAQDEEDDGDEEEDGPSLDEIEAQVQQRLCPVSVLHGSEGTREVGSSLRHHGYASLSLRLSGCLRE
jgi:hypothetical protein